MDEAGALSLSLSGQARSDLFIPSGERPEAVPTRRAGAVDLCQINQAWLDASMIACVLLAWLKLLALDGDLAKAEPKTLRCASCTPPAALSAAAGAGP